MLVDAWWVFVAFFGGSLFPGAIVAAIILDWYVNRYKEPKPKERTEAT